ncbi:MAG: prenyltransferase/squalene oxidase repeat-containing protein [Myxococcaceae bacterium]
MNPLAKRLPLGIVVLASVALAGSPPELEAQLCRAAKALEAGQGDFAGPSGRSRATWEWTKGGGAADNAAGVVALALGHQAKRCGVSASLARYAEARSAVHADWRFLYDPDVESLALASKVTGDPRFLSIAKEAFERRYGGASGKEIVERWRFNGRPRDLLGFDAALAIRAALAVGDQAKAKDLADAVIASQGFEGPDRSGFLTTSRGALLEALSMLGGAERAKVRQDLMHHLLLTQASDGSFGARNTQATAYAVRGLMRSADEAALSGAARGKQWLRTTQLRDGTWASFNDQMPEPFVGEKVPEITAEVMLAFAD